MDLFEKEGGRGQPILVSLSVQIKTPLEMHMREKSEAEERRDNQLLFP